jgi:uncharacterized protein (TIGR03083 family)
MAATPRRAEPHLQSDAYKFAKERAMTLPREIVMTAMLEGYGAFAELIVGLTEAQWLTMSRCGEWKVCDVAAHVAGQLTDINQLRLDGLGSEEATRREVDERRGSSARELSEELLIGAAQLFERIRSTDEQRWTRPAHRGAPSSLGSGMESLVFDTTVHADDVRHAAGLQSVRDASIAPALSHVAEVLSELDWGPATLVFDEGTFPVSGGGGRLVTGDALAFLLVASGRQDPLRFGLDSTVNLYR